MSSTAALIKGELSCLLIHLTPNNLEIHVTATCSISALQTLALMQPVTHPFPLFSPNTTPSSSPYPAHFSSSYLVPSQRLVSLLPHTHTSSPHLPHPAKSSPPHLASRPAASQSSPTLFSIFPILCPYLRPTLPMVTAGLGPLPCWFGDK